MEGGGGGVRNPPQGYNEIKKPSANSVKFVMPCIILKKMQFKKRRHSGSKKRLYADVTTIRHVVH